MRGHIRKRGSTYSIVVDIGRGENGKRKQKWISGFKTKKEAEKALAEIIAKIEKNELELSNM
ncbi:MAG: Arm DNA-binding domain-containing protein, partial [Caldanaerobacter sp.]